jgi:hypothetical protein
MGTEKAAPLDQPRQLARQYSPSDSSMWTAPELLTCEGHSPPTPVPLSASSVPEAEDDVQQNKMIKNVPSFRRWRFEMKLSPFLIDASRPPLEYASVPASW